MHFQDIIIRDLAKKYNIDPRVAKEICYYPLKFAKNIIRNPIDEKPIRVRYFGVFTQKHKENKQNRANTIFEILYNDISNTYAVMMSMLGFQLKNIDSARKVLEAARDSKDWDKLEMIWESYKEFKE